MHFRFYSLIQCAEMPDIRAKTKTERHISYRSISLYYNVLLLNVSQNDTTSVSAYINPAVYLRVAADYLSNVTPLLCIIIDTLPSYSLVGGRVDSVAVAVCLAHHVECHVVAVLFCLTKTDSIAQCNVLRCRSESAC